MRKCEMCGKLTEVDWAALYGFGHEHGKLCQQCAIEISEGKATKINNAPKKDLSKFDVPIYPPDELPKDLQKIADAFVNKPVTQEQDGPVIGQVTEVRVEGDFVVATLEVQA